MSSDGQNDGDLTGRDGGGRFLPGNSLARPGSRRGRPGKRTLAGLALMKALEEGDETLPSALDRWKALLTDPDPGVRLRAEVFVFAVLYGTAPRRPSLSNEPEVTEIRLSFGDVLDGPSS